jgi:hypothetical protein
MLVERAPRPRQGRRIVICDYNADLHSATNILRLNEYCVFVADGGLAAEELCRRMPDIALLVLNTFATGIDAGHVVGRIRLANPGVQILHIGAPFLADLPDDVPTIPEVFTAELLLSYVTALIERRRLPPMPGAGVPATSPALTREF